jgi:NAD(P)-dependent dehydrogenase (short-subunit alcohol dehydrogenase family)
MPAKVVLVTGCSAGGIGYALCQEFAARGCKVYATARSVQKMQGLEAAGCVVKALDVTDAKAVSSVVSGVLAAEGRIDVLVNNAGRGISGSVLDVPLDAARKLFETNFFACISLIQAVTPTMMKQRSGEGP